VAQTLDLAFRALSRNTPTVVVGADLARRYGSARAPAVNIGFSLVSRRDLVTLDAASAKPWGDELRVLSVGRLDAEKNPLLLADILAGLRARDPRWRLTVAGEGPLRQALEHRMAELGQQDAVELLGEVPNGPELWALYRRSHAFLHVSHTEGLPQVLFEAHAAGLPIVATDVGGVRHALGGGATGLLVPPRDAGAAIRSLDRLAGDESLRCRLMAAGLESAAAQTLEAQLDRLAQFFRATTPTARSS
jgi:glycosyltransferase involved in cell wall biosynthesis